MNNTIKNYTFSLRQFLAYPFLVLFLLIVGVLVWVFYENSMRMGRQMEQQLAVVLNGHVNHYLTQIFAEPVNAVNTIDTLYRSGKLKPGDVEDQAHHIATIMSTMPELTMLNFGFEDGHYIGVKRTLVNGALHTSVITSGTKSHRSTHSASEISGQKAFFSEDANPLEPRMRQWYLNAIQQGKASWYPVVHYAESDKYNAISNVGLGYSMQVYDESAKFVGVINSDVALAQISRYLKLLPLGQGGIAFITDDQHQIIGTSTDAPLFYPLNNTKPKDSKLRLVHVENSESPLIRAAGELLVKNGVGSSRLSLQEENYVEDVREFKTASGLNLNIVVLLPETQFFPMIQSDIKSMLVFIAIALIIGIAFVFIIAYRLSKPMVQITRWTRQLTKGDWELLRQPNDNALKDYPIKEIRQLRNSFSDMAASLHETVATLEVRVAERTAELEQANHHLSVLSNTDGLTGIANRRKFDEMLAIEWSRSSRSGQPLVLALIDVDWFKKYNDHYGHLAGDECLRRVADILKAKIRRSSDLVARYGGEEFAIIAPGMNTASVIEMANIICTTLAKAALPHDLSPFGIITASIGVASIIPGIDTNPETLIQAADEALYRSKECGRNQVTCTDVGIAEDAGLAEIIIND